MSAIFGFAHSVCAYAQPTEKCGEFVIKYALLWLPEYFPEPYTNVQDPFIQEMEQIARTIRNRSLAETPIYKLGRDNKTQYEEHHYSWKADSLVRFLPESSGEFQIEGSPTARVAVTGDALDSEVIFNSDKISDRSRFSYEDAIVLWVHEIGHKYKARRELNAAEKLTVQGRIDDLATMIGKRFSSRAVVESSPLLAFNGTPFGTWGMTGALISRQYNSRDPNHLFIRHGDELTDLTPVLNRELDRWSNRLNSFQIMRRIREIHIWDQQPGVIRARIRFYVNRRPLNLDFYTGEDLASHVPYVADVVIRDGTLKVVRYVEDRPDVKRAEDAELEVPYFKINEDGTFIAEMHLHVSTIRNFHVGSYPANDKSKLVFLVDGQAVDVGIQMHANLKDRGWGLMPAEAYKTPMLKRARIGGVLPKGWRGGFEVIGMITDFFELGYSSGQVPLMVSMKSPLRSRAGCEGELTKNSDVERTPYINGYGFYGRPNYLR